MAYSISDPAPRRSLLRAFFDVNIRATKLFDRLLPIDVTTRGGPTFANEVLPRLLLPGMRIYEMGGGSRPFLDLDRKAALGATVIGLDISPEELSAAPPGAYDQTIVADLTQYTGSSDADLVICRTTIEHVRDAAAAMRGLASTLAPGGRAALLIPCRNTLFARLNLLLPERLKLKLLAFFHADKGRDGHDGFPAFYDQCTPSKLAALAREAGLEVELVNPHWTSNYFRFFLPLYLVWRGWSVIARNLLGPDFCENFIMVLRKPGLPSP